jgi:hypothetical protein
MIIFGSVWFLTKKVTKLNLFFKKTKIGSNRPVSVRFGFLGQKLVQTGLTWFFQFCLVLSGLAQFFQFGFSLVQF